LKDNSDDNIWKKLSKDLDRYNPRTFELPDWLVDEYENLVKNPVTGDYLDISQWKSIRIGRNGTISNPSQSESYLKTIPICYKCGEGISKVVIYKYNIYLYLFIYLFIYIYFFFE